MRFALMIGAASGSSSCVSRDMHVVLDTSVCMVARDSACDGLADVSVQAAIPAAQVLRAPAQQRSS